MKKDFFVRPVFYDNFKCKCGDCVNCCCCGWPISISMDEYFRLIGMDCSSDLRNRLDIAFHLVDDGNRDENRYAQITPRFDGWCPLHGEDGLCMIQKEKGEEIIPSVCRLYPRSIRNSDGEEVLSNSCEKVIEMLIGLKKPMEFVAPKRNLNEITYNKILRIKILKIMQNRSFTLSNRICLVGTLLKSVERCNEENAKKRIDSFECKLLNLETDENKRIKIQISLLKWIKDNSFTERDFCEKAMQNLGINEREIDYESVLKLYSKRKTVLYRDFPRFDEYLEQILVNHIFYDKFPFSDRRENFMDEFRSLCVTYAFLMSLAIGCIDKDSNLTKLVSLFASSFRFIDHSSFDYNMSIIAKKNGIKTLKQASNLLDI